MTLYQPTQSPGTPTTVPVLPLLFRLGDDWTISVALANTTTGDPVDLTGAQVTARLYCPFPLDIAGPNGLITVTNATEGALSVVIAATATGGVNPQTVLAQFYPCRLTITVVDTLGHKHTYDPIPILPLRQQDDAPVPTQGQVQILTTYQQGPAGASNSLTATEVNALVLAVVAAALAGQSVPIPVDTAVPVISGNAVVGQVLIVTSGAWANNPISYAYAWDRDGVAISGATSQAYTVVQADIGHALTCAVTATNGGGTATATSSATGTVTAALAAPVNTATPVISGTPQVGVTLTVAPGTYTGNPTPTLARQWLAASTPIAGAVGLTYTPVAGDVGKTLTVVETATNTQGSITETSAATAAVTAAVSPPGSLGLDLSGGTFF